MKKFSVREAKEYAKKGLLEEWIHDFLITMGKNENLSLGLKKEKRYWVGPITVSLDKLYRVCGTEKNIKFREGEERWEKRINRIINGIKSGWEMPPFIVTYKRRKLIIADGSHRHEALKRRGFKKYWAVIWYDSVEELVKHNTMKTAVFFITGTSSSGKTTLVNFFKKELSFAEVHDFDEGGVPPNADEKWRKKRTNEWLEKATFYQTMGKSTIICGVSVPEEIKKSKAYSPSLNVHYGFIYIDEQEIRKRLTERGWKEKLIEDNINWSKHLEKYVRAEKNNYIVDGKKYNAQQVAKKFIDWILRETVK